jgi:hypothetical protein
MARSEARSGSCRAFRFFSTSTSGPKRTASFTRYQPIGSPCPVRVKNDEMMMSPRQRSG